MTVSDYAESRKISTQAVRSAIKRYPELDGHISNEGKKFILDTFAVDFLDKNLRLPSTVIDDRLVIEFQKKENESQAKLIKILEENKDKEKENALALFKEVNVTRQDMLSQINEGFEKLSQLQGTPYDDSKVVGGIERLETLVSELNSELARKNEEIDRLKTENDNLRSELKSMTDKYMEESSKSVMQKIFGKK